jgi:hypothetical protein
MMPTSQRKMLDARTTRPTQSRASAAGCMAVTRALPIIVRPPVQEVLRHGTAGTQTTTEPTVSALRFLILVRAVLTQVPAHMDRRHSMIHRRRRRRRHHRHRYRHRRHRRRRRRHRYRHRRHRHLLFRSRSRRNGWHMFFMQMSVSLSHALIAFSLNGNNDAYCSHFSSSLSFNWII